MFNPFANLVSKGAVFPLLFLSSIWIVAVNLFCYLTWGKGPFKFVALLVICSLPIIASRVFRWPRPRNAKGRSRMMGVVLCFLLVSSISLTMRQVSVFVASTSENARGNQKPLIDIAFNTLLATGRFFSEGKNPYSHRCQVAHRLEDDRPHVEIRGRKTFTYGIPYRYGYPYFPAMFLSYGPFYISAVKERVVRWGNAFFFLLHIVGVPWLTFNIYRSRGSRHGAFGALLALTLYVSVWKWGDQIFVAGVTDIVPSAFILFGFLSLSKSRVALGGILFGLAQSAKLLPVPFFLLILFPWLLRRGRSRRFFLAFLLTGAVVTLPFVLWNPSHFLSATILFYLTNHAEGDSTSLWYFLPAAWQTPFFLFGILLTSLPILLAWKWKSGEISRIVSLCFFSFTIFIAFSRMSHANYLLGIYAIGCVALSTAIKESSEPGRGEAAK